MSEHYLQQVIANNLPTFQRLEQGVAGFTDYFNQLDDEILVMFLHHSMQQADILRDKVQALEGQSLEDTHPMFPSIVILTSLNNFITALYMEVTRRLDAVTEQES